MPRLQLAHNIPLNLPLPPLIFTRLQGKPLFLKRVPLTLDKDDFVLAPVEVVANHNLVTIPLQRCPCLGNQQVWVRFELQARASVAAVCAHARACTLTLKLTMKPSGAHCCTIGFSTLGTWSISINNEPLPD